MAMNKRKSAKGRGRPPAISKQSIPVQACATEPNECVGCGKEDEILVPLPREICPSYLFPKFVKDKSRGCINCVYHAIQVNQVRDAMSYKLDMIYQYKQCCLVCNATSGLIPMSSVEGAREAISHPIINAHNIEAYLKVPCSLCISCAYPLQWLYNTYVAKKNSTSYLTHITKKKGVLQPELEPRLTSTTPSATKSARRAAPLVLKEESPQSDMEEVPKSTRRRSYVPAQTLAKSAITKVQGGMSIRGKRTIELEETEINVKASIKKEPAATPPASKKRQVKPNSLYQSEDESTPPSAKNIKAEERPSCKKVAATLTATKTRQVKLVKRSLSESEDESTSRPAKKVKAGERPSRQRTRAVTKTEVQQTLKASSAGKTRTPAMKKMKSRTQRKPRPSLSPPRKLGRRKTELQERVCETCQQIFYSGVELALHELRHTGRVLRIVLDRNEIPEPLRTLERSYLFELPVNLAGPSQSQADDEKPLFEFSEPEYLTETPNSSLGAIQTDPLEIREEEHAPFEAESKDDSMDNADSQVVVGNLIESLADPLEEESTPVKEVPETPKAPLITNVLSFDFFAPSSPKEPERSMDESVSEELKTPPPVISSLSFDFFPEDDSPSKSHNFFSPAHVDPSQALKANSDNPPLPLPCDSDNSLLTPPRVRPIEVEQAIDDMP